MSKRARDHSEGTVIELGPIGIAVGLLLIGIVIVGGLWWYSQSPGASGTSMSPNLTAPGSAPGGPVSDEPGAWFTSGGEPAIGATGAPVTIVEYTDFQCGNCRQFATHVLPWLRESWIGDGFVNVVVRDFAMLGPGSTFAAEAAHCAAEQGRYWAYHDALFEAQPGPFDDELLRGLAAGIGLDDGAFAECLDSDRHRASVDASTQSALNQGFDGTPTYLINGMKVQGAIEIERWQQLFEAFSEDFARATVASGGSSDEQPGAAAGADARNGGEPTAADTAGGAP